MLSVNCYKILNTHVEAEGGEKKDDLQVNQLSGMGLNSNSDLGVMKDVIGLVYLTFHM